MQKIDLDADNTEWFNELADDLCSGNHGKKVVYQKILDKRGRH